MRKAVAAAGLLGLLLSGVVETARAAAGADGAAFLQIPVGARPAALGGAYDALAVDAYAPAINPAGLGFLPSAGIAASHLSYMQSISYDALSAAAPLRSGGVPNGGGLGVSVQYVSPGRTAGTDVNGNPIGDYNGDYYAAGAAYGRAVTPRLSLGVAAKAIGAQIDGVSARAYAADLGALYRLNDKLVLSAVAANLGSPLKFISNADPLPRQFRAGAAFHATPGLDLIAQGLYDDAGAGVNGGAEWRPLDPLALRVGYQSEAVRDLSGLAGVTFGVGLKCAGIEFSYALVPMGDLGMTNYFSLTVAMGGSPR